MSNVQVSEVEYQTRSIPSLLARIYQPSGRGPFPALVSVHGGAWIGNDRTSNQVLDIALAMRDIVIVAIDFRLAPDAPYPASIVDINFAVRWLKHRASRHASRPELVGGIGTSSGGHQLLLSALRPNDRRYRALPLDGDAAYSAELSSLVLCWPVVDPVDRYAMAKARAVADMLRTQEAYFGNTTAMDEADPLRLLERGESVDLPPTLVVDGTSDDRLTPDGLGRFVSAYGRAGGTIRRMQFEGQGHTFIVKDPTTPASVRAIDAIASFVHEQAQSAASVSGVSKPAERRALRQR